MISSDSNVLSAAVATSPSGIGKNSLISLGEVCRLLGVHENTARRYANEGQLTAYRTPGGHRRYERSQVLALATGEEEVENENVVIIYGRVSTQKQKDDLGRQLQRLRDYAGENYKGQTVIEVNDCGSGLNMERKGFVRLIDNILSGKYDGATLLVENKDRVARWAVSLVEQICRHHKIEVVYVEQQDCDDEEMLAADLMSIIHIFSCKSYSKRSSATKSVQLAPKTIERGKELIDSGLSCRAVADVLEKEGHRDEEGQVIGQWVVYNRIKLALGKLEKVIPQKANATSEYLAQFISKGAEEIRTPQTALYEHYKTWAEKNGVVVLSARKFFIQLAGRFELCANRRKKCYVGLVIKGGENLSFTARRFNKEEAPINHFLDFVARLGKWSGLYVDFRRQYESYCDAVKSKPISRGQSEKVLVGLGAKLKNVQCKHFSVAIG